MTSGAQQAVMATAPVAAPTPAPSLHLATFQDYVEAVDDLRLRSDLERYVSVVSFAPGQAEVFITEPRHNSLIGRMVRSLQELTGSNWLVSPAEAMGEPTLADARRAAKAAQDAEDRSHPAFAHPLLKDAELLGITDRAPNVIAGNFTAGDDR